MYQIQMNYLSFKETYLLIQNMFKIFSPFQKSSWIHIPMTLPLFEWTWLFLIRFSNKYFYALEEIKLFKDLNNEIKHTRYINIHSFLFLMNFNQLDSKKIYIENVSSKSMIISKQMKVTFLNLFFECKLLHYK